MAFVEKKGQTGPIVKWDTPGQVIEGRYLSSKNGKIFQGKQSRLAILLVDGAETAVPLTTVLETMFGEVTPGTLVRITYVGKVRGKSGVEYKDFKFEVDDASTQTGAVAPQTGGNLQTNGGVTEYDLFAQRLRQKVGPTSAEAMLAALPQFYPDPAKRLEALKQAVG